MNIYLIRHGEADRPEPDAEKELTPAGKTSLVNQLTIWKNYIQEFDYIVSSPKKRTIQTAEYISEQFLKDHNNFLKDDKVGPGSKIEDIIELANILDAEDIAFTGHLPDVENHLSDLISNSGMQARFKPACLAKISFEGKAGKSKGTLELFLNS